MSGLVALVAGGCARAGGEAAAPLPALSATLDDDARRWVDETLADLTLEQAVAQLVIPWMSGDYQADDDEGFAELLDQVDLGVGGVSISIGVPDAYVSKLNRLQARARIPLLVTSDFENGGPGMRINHAYALPSLLPQGGGTSFPPTMAFGAAGDPALAFEYGRVTAVEARAVGVHWLFAPVMDVNSNPENPIINTRAFGEDPTAVGRLGVAFIRGAREGGALTTAKHFPGHGDTRTDSHVELPIVAADRARLDAVELVPFRMAIEAGVDAVMTAHVAVPGVLGSNEPATLSPELMTTLLREEMGFDGILFTDALRMGALTEGYGAGEAAVLALEAGSDVLLAPADVRETVSVVADAVRSGRLTRERIDESARRLLSAKARLGLHRARRVDPDRVSEVVGSAAHDAVAEDAARRAITLVRDARGTIPLGPGRSVLSVTFARGDDLLAGRTFDGTLRSYASVRSARVAAGTPWAVYDSLLAVSRDVDAVLVATYLPPRSGAGTASVPVELRSFLEQLADREGPPAVLLSFGSPYVLTAFPEADAYLVAWGDREGPQEAAARAVAGASAIGGRLPISIPPLHRGGEGLDRQPLATLAAVTEEEIDPLQEAGFIPGEEDPVTASGESGPTGGPGRWTPTPGPPPCPSAPVRPAGPMPVTGDLPADTFCVRGASVASRREVDPASVGMSADSLAALDVVIADAVLDSAASGAALAVVRQGRLVRLRGFGRHDWDPDAPLVTPASIFDLASLTKVVGTTSAVMLLAQRGALALDDRVVDHLPWWSGGDPAKAEVTIRQLLLHQGGLPPFRRFFLEMRGRAAYQEAIGALPLAYPPGDSTVYSDIGLMTIGFVVEAVTGQPLDVVLERDVWGPLGMADTGFNPPPEIWDRVVTTELDEGYRNQHVHGVVHDENAHAIGGVVGHAGLFSSARDLAVFAQMMLDRGTAGTCRPDLTSGVPCHQPRFRAVSVFEPGWVEGFTRRQSAGSSRALGWDTPSAGSSAGDYFTARAFGHTGYTGTSIWIDPSLDLAVVLLTNRVNPSRENTKHVALRRRVHDLVARAIVDRPPGPRPGR